MKNLKKIIIGLVMVVLVVGYYFYLSNKPMTPQPVVSANEEVAKLINRNLEGAYYPQFPADVVKFYSRIMQAYYSDNVTDKEVRALGSQARKLFDTELLAKNPEEEFYKKLEADVEEYHKLERIIPDFTVESAADIKPFTFQQETYAKVLATYLVREKGSIATIYQEYTLRKDKSGYWKILFWENAQPPVNE